MPRETKAQKATRISMLLAEFDARQRELRKLDKIVDGLKEQVRDIEPGTYGEWVLSQGTPREIVDQAAIKLDYTERGVALPTKMTAPPIVVRPAAGK